MTAAERFTTWWADMLLRASYVCLQLEALTDKERRIYLKEIS